MILEFVVIDSQGKETDWVSPYLGHREVMEGVFAVQNDYAEYEVTIPDGSTYVIRPYGS